MRLERIETLLAGVFILKPLDPHKFEDNRGSLRNLDSPDDAWQALQNAGIKARHFRHGIESTSHRQVVRGLHWQNPQQAKLIEVVQGEILDVVVDVSPDSPTYRKHIKVQLSADNGHRIYIPRGYAHGFLVLSPATPSRPDAIVRYLCDESYYSNGQRGVRWNDPQLNIGWTTTTPILSEKDATLPLLADIPPDQLPRLS